jgi:hypothetical protein
VRRLTRASPAAAASSAGSRRAWQAPQGGRPSYRASPFDRRALFSQIAYVLECPGAHLAWEGRRGAQRQRDSRHAPTALAASDREGDRHRAARQNARFAAVGCRQRQVASRAAKQQRRPHKASSLQPEPTRLARQSSGKLLGERRRHCGGGAAGGRTSSSSRNPIPGSHRRAGRAINRSWDWKMHAVSD